MHPTVRVTFKIKEPACTENKSVQESRIYFLPFFCMGYDFVYCNAIKGFVAVLKCECNPEDCRFSQTAQTFVLSVHYCLLAVFVSMSIVIFRRKSGQHEIEHEKMQYEEHNWTICGDSHSMECLQCGYINIFIFRVFGTVGQKVTIRQ